MPEQSTKVVYAALAGNALVAVSKFVAAAISGSTAMFTEAIHSSADCANQVLLLIGDRRSRSAPDRTHAFGYGLEIYFWTFVVAMMVLLAGGGVSIYTGIRRLASPEPLTSPRLNLMVLAVSAIFEGMSFAFGYREYRRVVRRHVTRGKTVGIWLFIQRSKDPNLYESLLEDLAALAGIGIAALGVVASAYGGLVWADGAASITIGILLVVISLIIAAATRSLVAGEAVAPPVLADIQNALRRTGNGLGVAGVETLHLGPEDILIALTLEPDFDLNVAAMRRGIDQITTALETVDRRITRIVFRFSQTGLGAEAIAANPGGSNKN